jgi:exonuclease SbcD
MSDLHLGAFRDPTIRQLERQALEEACKKCVELKVDFVLICGDIFHVSIPDLSIVRDTMLAFRILQDAKIPIYAIYGSHDSTPNGTSVIDILDTAGIITNIYKPHIERSEEEGEEASGAVGGGGRRGSEREYVELEFFVDPKTGAKMTGISARRIGLESQVYEKLDRVCLESQKGPKIFAFHSGIAEFKPAFLKEMETIPISYLPKGFDYYAGGHIHLRGEFHFPGFPKVVFPGPTFTGYGKDIEETARGEPRGFYLVEFGDDGKLESAKFVQVKGFDGAFLEYDASGKNSQTVRSELSKKLDDLEVNGRVVVIRVKGELAGGKTTDIDFSELGRKLMTRGAAYVHFNRFSLTSREYAASRIAGEDIPAIESNLFRENIGAVKVSQANLKGEEEGVHSAVELLKLERQPQKGGESKGDYAARLLRSGVETLKLKKEFSVTA